MLPKDDMGEKRQGQSGSERCFQTAEPDVQAKQLQPGPPPFRKQRLMFHDDAGLSGVGAYRDRSEQGIEVKPRQRTGMRPEAQIAFVHRRLDGKVDDRYGSHQRSDPTGRAGNEPEEAGCRGQEHRRRSNQLGNDLGSPPESMQAMAPLRHVGGRTAGEIVQGELRQFRKESCAQPCFKSAAGSRNLRLDGNLQQRQQGEEPGDQDGRVEALQFQTRLSGSVNVR